MEWSGGNLQRIFMKIRSQPQRSVGDEPGLSSSQELAKRAVSNISPAVPLRKTLGRLQNRGSLRNIFEQESINICCVSICSVEFSVYQPECMWVNVLSAHFVTQILTQLIQFIVSNVYFNSYIKLSVSCAFPIRFRLLISCSQTILLKV